MKNKKGKLEGMSSKPNSVRRRPLRFPISAFGGFRFALLCWEAPGSAQAVTRERPASCDAREAARAGRGERG
jgi:hypothetical protein